MLLHLSRASFWLAALAAAWSLVGPASQETTLTVVAGAAALVALALWRSAMVANRRSAVGDAAVPQPTLLTSDSLVDAAAAVARAADAAPDFDTAVQAAASVLKSELGARAAHCRPGTERPAPALDRATIELPRRIVVPVGGADAPSAWIELDSIEMDIDPQALASLLELTRSSLRGVEHRVAAAPAMAPAMAPAVARTTTPFVTPFSTRPGAPASGPHRPEASGRIGAAGKSGMHVLVVEDNVVQTETTARMLRHLGCRVTMASGMLEGLHALCATQFDLVLMDTHMPGISASEALNWLRDRSQGAFQLDSVRGAPIVALAWNGSQGDAERFRELGFDDCLPKPLRLRQLHAMLSRHACLRSPQPEAGGAGVAPAAEVLDPVALARLRELDPKGENQLVERVLKAFQTSAARLGPQLQAARESHDRATVRLVVHTLKSSSASIGALTLSQQCAELEATIRNETGEDIEPAIAAIIESLEIVVKAIQRTLDAPR